MGSIGSHVLGGVGSRREAGLEGIELKFNNDACWSLMASKRTLKDARRRPIFVDADDYIPAQHGQHLILTIDANIQTIAEQELWPRHVKNFKADKPVKSLSWTRWTGEVLALA